MLIPLFLFFGSLIIYLHNLSSSVYGGDVGDFLSAVAVRGVPHPPGYPLFTVLGILFSYIPLSVTLAYKVGMISALASSLTLVFVYLTIKRLAKSTLVSLFAALLLGFSYIFFLYAEIAEVFALNSFFAACLLYLGVLYYQTKKDLFLYLLAFTAGLSLTNHQTIIFIFPSLLILVLHKKLIRQWKKPLVCLILLILGFSIYIYVPLAASHNPPVNWDKAATLGNFIHLVLRQDYGTFSSGIASVSQNAPLSQRFFTLAQYQVLLRIYLSPIALILGLFGAGYLFAREKRIFWALLSAFLISGPLFIFYIGLPLSSDFSIGIFERFLILSTIFVVSFAAFGILFLSRVFGRVLSDVLPEKNRIPIYILLFQLLFFLIPLFLFRYNYPKTNLSNVFLGDIYAKDLLSPLPKNAIVILSGDTAILNVAYVQYGLHFRQDVMSVNVTAPSLNYDYTKLRRNMPKNIQGGQSVSVKELIFLAKHGKQIFSKDTFSKGRWVPFGLVYKLDTSAKKTTESQYAQQTKNIWDKLYLPYPKIVAAPAFHNLTVAGVPDYYSQAAINTGYYFASEYHDMKKAKQFFEKAVAIAPMDPDGYRGLGYIYLNNNNCMRASDMLRKSLAIEPTDQVSLLLLYSTYKSCLNDPKKAKEIANKYKDLFGKDINVGIKNLVQIR